MLSLLELFSAACTSLAACNFGSFERLFRASTFMLVQVESSSYTEKDSRRKTSCEHRRNGERMGGNGKPTREAEEREEWRCSYKDYRPWQDGAAADACVGVRITCIDSPGGRVRKWGKFHGGRAVVRSFRGMKNVPGWRDVGSGTSQWRTLRLGSETPMAIVWQWRIGASASRASKLLRFLRD